MYALQIPFQEYKTLRRHSHSTSGTFISVANSDSKSSEIPGTKSYVGDDAFAISELCADKNCSLYEFMTRQICNSSPDRTSILHSP